MINHYRKILQFDCLRSLGGASRPLWLYRPDPGTLPEGQVYLSQVSGGGTIEVRNQDGGALIYSSDKARSANLWSLVSSMNLHCIVTAPEDPEQTPGEIVLEYRYVNGAFQCSDRVKVTVVKVDLDVQQVSDADESIIGGFLGVNNDDDNGNSMEDKDPLDTPVAGEDNLIRLDLSHELGTASGGSFQLRCDSGCDAIKVWDSMNKVTAISLPATWAPGSVPSSLYVEGLQPVTYQGDVNLALTWFYNSPFMAFSDYVRLSVVDVSLAAEANMTDPSGRLSCMEGREVTYTATAHPLFPHGLFNPICFVFNYETAAGVHWTDTDWSTDLLEDNTAVADDVLAGDADHMFTTPIYVEASNDSVQTQSNTLEVDVYELWIEYFRDASTHKDWKVVVGDPIEYSAIASSDTHSFQWQMPDGVPDQWHPTGGNAKSGNGMVIPNSDMPVDSDWDHFGDAYGTIRVICEDSDGNDYTFSSSSMTPQKVKIFFSPGTQTNPSANDDNWFYYWKYALFNNISNVVWNPSMPYGYTDNSGNIEIGDSINNDYVIPFNYTQLFGYPRPSADGKTGIDLFYCILTHELQHRADSSYFQQTPDSDNDYLPDSVDPFPSLINGAGYSEYTGGLAWQGDWEYRARAVENVNAPASKDWSKNGKNW